MDLFKGPSPHRSLREDEFRLLKLLPGGFDDPIKCRLEHASLASAPQYMALSYTWGDATRTSPICLDDRQYPITTNLEVALRHLRHPRDSTTLWADAICINQIDIQERNIQVTRMRDIYEQAAGVIVWLGDYAPQTKKQVDSAFSLVERIFDLLTTDNYTEAAIQDMIKDREPDIHVLSEIIHRPWFNRVWVIQEVAICKAPENYVAGPDHPMFVCGRSSIAFSAFCLSTAVIMNAFGRVPAGHYHTRPNDVTWIHDMRRVRNGLLTGHITLTQVEQLVTFLTRSAWAFQATDERDKVYALLGLLSFKTLPPPLQPNYALTADQIFWDYAVYILRETKYLDILTCCSTSRPGLPSWVPDWKNGYPSELFHIGKVSHLRFLEENKKIEVDCLILGHIDKILHPVEIPVGFDGLIDLEWESNDSAVMLSQSQDKIGKLAKGMAYVYDTILTIEKKWFGCRALDANLEPTELELWIAGLQIGFRGPKSIHDPQWHGYSSRQLYEKLMNLSQLSFDGGLEVLSAMGEYCAMIKLALRTSMYQDNNGKYGRVRDSKSLLTTGDAICYLKGGSYRFLIRPEQGGWRLVGTDWGRFPISREVLESGNTKELRDFWASNEHSTRRIVLH